MSFLAALSDSHLGYRHRFKTQRLKDYRASFIEAIDAALATKPAVLVLGGDMLHQPKPDPVSMRSVIKKLLEAAQQTQVVYAIGNHEISGHLGTAYQPLFSDLHENIHVLSTENPRAVIKAGGKKITFHGFQYLRSRDACEKQLAEISNQVEESDANILLLHQAIERYLSPYEISLKALRSVSEKYDLILVGHVHKHQHISEVFDVTPSYYIGSTERVSFNEWENPTGFMVFDSTDFTKPTYETVSSARMRKISASFEEITPEELNTEIRKLIEANKDASLLSVEVSAELKGDLLDVKTDYSDEYPQKTILEVNVSPKTNEKQITIERLELSEDTIREYFEKTGLSNEGELLGECISLYEEYSK